MSANLKQIAKRVGISTASVSIYLNNPDTNRVSAATKKKINQATADLNYRKNFLASSLSRDSSQVIGIIIPSSIPLFQNGYTNTLLSGIQNLLSRNGFSLLFFPSTASSSRENVREQLQNSGGCDGFILFSTGFCTMDHILLNIQELKGTGKPFVTLNIPEVPVNVNQIIMDDLESIRGFEYLLEAGHRRILMLLGRRDGEHMQILLKNYRKKLKEIGIPFDNDLVVYGNYSYEDSYLKVNRFLSGPKNITGICCMSDLMASSALAAVKSTGRSVPADISIVGRNNSLYSILADPPLTTIDLKIEDAGLQAARLLLESMEGSRPNQKIHIEAELVERSSVNEIALEN